MTSKLPAKVEYTPEWVELLCKRIAGGDSVRRIAKDDGWPKVPTIMGWLTRHEDFRVAYAVACELRAEALAEEALEIADDSSHDTKIGERGGEICDTEWVQRSRLRVDTRKWMAGKLAPKKYGDKLDVNHGGAIAVGDIDRPERESREAWLKRQGVQEPAAARGRLN